jgi:uncharacterized Fe-S cluster protein YjdI
MDPVLCQITDQVRLVSKRTGSDLTLDGDGTRPLLCNQPSRYLHCLFVDGHAWPSLEYSLTSGRGCLTSCRKRRAGSIMKVFYDAQVCIHASNCVKSLPAVFKVVDGQFVTDQQGASEAAIRQTVAACPSGALQITDD